MMYFLVFKHTVLRRDEVVLDTVRALTQQQLVIFTVCLNFAHIPSLASLVVNLQHSQ